MYVDDFLEFADATALNATATGTKNIGSTIDLETVRDIGAGKQLYVCIQITTDLGSGGAATIRFQLVSDASGTPATNGNQSVHVASEAFTATDLDQGEVVILPVPAMGYGAPTQYERYLGVQQVVGTATLTAGAVNAFLTCDPPVPGQRIKGFSDPLARDPNQV